MGIVQLYLIEYYSKGKLQHKYCCHELVGKCGCAQPKGIEMKREFNVVIERDKDGYFVASVPALHGCHTQARSLDVLMKRVKEAIELCLEVEDPISNEFIGVQRVAVNL